MENLLCTTPKFNCDGNYRYPRFLAITILEEFDFSSKKPHNFMSYAISDNDLFNETRLVDLNFY